LVHYYLLFKDIESAVRNVKHEAGEAASIDNIVSEHTVNSHPCLIVHLKKAPVSNDAFTWLCPFILTYQKKLRFCIICYSWIIILFL